MLCPGCQQDDAERVHQIVLISTVTWCLLGALATLLSEPGGAGWAFLNLALLQLMTWACVIPHEVGHALAARVVGLEVLHIVIGKGRRWWHGTLAGTRVELHWLPFDGFTVAAIRNEPHARVKQLAVVAGGPLVNILMLWAALTAVSRGWIEESIHTGPAPVFAFIGANALVLLINLWPRGLVTAVGASRTDGALLLRLLFTRDHDFALLERGCRHYGLQLAAMQPRRSGAVAAARRAIQEHGDSPVLQTILSAALLNADCYREARETLLLPVQQTATPPAVRAALYNNLACANLNLDDDTLAAETLALAARAHRWLPWEPCIVANLGCAEALFGDSQAALRLLASRRIARHSPQLHAAALSGLALAHAREGATGASLAALRAAQEADAECHLLQIVRRQLGVRDAMLAS